MTRERREKAAQEVQNAIEKFNGNPNTEQALRAIAEYLNLDI